MGTTTDNGARLQVSGQGLFSNTTSGSANNVLVVRNAASTVVNTEARLFLSTVAGDDRGAYISSIITSASNDNALILAVNSAGASPTERMRITSGGNVQIGNDSNPFLYIANGGSTDVTSGINWLYGSGLVNGGGIEMAAPSGNNFYMIFKTRNSGSTAERMRITSGGNVGINTASPRTAATGGHATLDIKGGIYFGSTASESTCINNDDSMIFNIDANNDASGVNFFRFATNTTGETGGTELMRITDVGTIFMNNLGGYSVSYADVRFDTTSKELYYQTSSIRYKTNITNLENSIDKINLLRPVRYQDKNKLNHTCGLIAEEVYKIIPEVVFKKQIDGFDEPQIEGINYSDFVPFLIKSIQEQQEQIQELKNKLS
jgi:hypothetical protein